jgi:hypothetical protein
MQSLTRWVPFLSEGQAHHRHSPSTFHLSISEGSIPSVLEESFFGLRLAWSFLILSLPFLKAFFDLGVGLIFRITVLP